MNNEIKEILEIFKKINEEYSVDTELDFEDYEIPNIYLKQFLDYITNLHEELNATLKNYGNLVKEWKILQEENKKLKELCDKYEEEHSTTFEEWKKDINIIKNLDKMFEYYFLGNLKYDQDTVNTIYIKYVKLKELNIEEK